MSDELVQCKERLAALEQENAELRAASETFGDLAERLNQELQWERRSGQERRVTLRPTPDRRAALAASRSSAPAPAGD